MESNINFFQDTGLTNQYIVAANFPLRVWNCINACQEKRYWKAALDVFAFSSLFFPLYGPKAAILIDLASEAMNVYIKMHSDSTTRHPLSFLSYSNCKFEKIKNFFCNENKKHEIKIDKIDCTIRENALIVLGLTAEEAGHTVILDEKYQDVCEELNKRIIKARELKSEFFAKEFEKILNEIHKSYETLTR